MKMPSKLKYYIFRIAAIVVAIAMPVWAIIEKFPIWINTQGTYRTAGASVCMILIVVFFTFRSTILSILKEKNWFKHAPPVAWWIGFTLVSIVLAELSKVMNDFKIIGIAGIIGCLIGTGLNYIAVSRFRK